MKVSKLLGATMVAGALASGGAVAGIAGAAAAPARGHGHHRARPAQTVTTPTTTTTSTTALPQPGAGSVGHAVQIGLVRANTRARTWARARASSSGSSGSNSGASGPPGPPPGATAQYRQDRAGRGSRPRRAARSTRAARLSLGLGPPESLPIVALARADRGSRSPGDARQRSSPESVWLVAASISHVGQLAGRGQTREVDGLVVAGPAPQPLRVGARGAFHEHLQRAPDEPLGALARVALDDLDQALHPLPP